MAGYTASGRLHGAVPRFVAIGDRAELPRTPTPVVATGSTMPGEPAPEAVPIELVGRPLDAIVGDWLASIGESWSQLTFFLFDPQSWR